MNFVVSVFFLDGDNDILKVEYVISVVVLVWKWSIVFVFVWCVFFDLRKDECWVLLLFFGSSRFGVFFYCEEELKMWEWWWFVVWGCDV